MGVWSPAVAFTSLPHGVVHLVGPWVLSELSPQPVSVLFSGISTESSQKKQGGEHLVRC